MSEAENKRKKRHRSSRSGGHTPHTGHGESARKHSSRGSGHHNRKRSHKKNRISILSIIIDVILLTVMAAFDIVLAMVQILPMKFLALIYILLLGIVMCVIMLVDKPRKKGRFYTGITIGLVIISIMLIGIFAMAKGLSTVNNMTGNTTETAHIGVYVKAGDPAQSMEEVSSYTFGMMAVLDRENVDHSVEEINSILNTQIVTQECSGLSELVNSLYAGEVGAILLNDAYLDVLADTEEFATIKSDIRELTQIKVEQVINKAENSKQDENSDDNTITIFISGIDSRNGLAARSRSDVNILATINTETRQVLLVSTPRDYFVPLSISNGAPDKLTHAGIYGVDVSMDTISMLYGIDVDYYFRVNFGGFEKIIDSLGGITVNSDFAFTSYFGHYKFNKGENHVNGAQALAFARERYAFSEGDRQRGKNHMAIIQGVINKALSPDILTNYLPLMDAVSGSFEMSVPYDLIASIVREQLQNGGSWNIVSYSVNGTGANKVPYSMSSAVYVMIPDQATVDTAKDLIKQVENGETITAP